MATDMGKVQETKSIFGPMIWKRDAREGRSQGFMIVSKEIMLSANGCSKTIEMKRFDVNGTILQKKITLIECQNLNSFTTGKFCGSLSTIQETLQNLWETFWLQPSVVYIKPLTPRSRRTTTQTHALLDVPTIVSGTATVIEFFRHLVAMERILVVFLRIQRKSTQEGYDQTGRPVAKTSEDGFQ